jgi:hypothetical protein
LSSKDVFLKKNGEPRVFQAGRRLELRRSPAKVSSNPAFVKSEFSSGGVELLGML